MDVSHHLTTLLPHDPTASSVGSTVISLTVFFTLLCACIVIGHLFVENRWVNDSTIAILLGLCAGFVTLLISKWKSSRILVFSDQLFFIFLLPPIIFNAGFQVKKKQFFRNFLTIMLFGVFGTLVSFCIISIEMSSSLLFGTLLLISKPVVAVGAIFSATDSVCTLQVLSQEETPLLYSLVFGEGVVNDATSIVLFNAVRKLDFSDIDTLVVLKLLGTFVYLFFTSTAIGIGVGLLSAYVIKTLYFGRHSTDREVAIMMLMAYLSYMLAELFSLSGILTVFFCGILMSHYTWHNVTENSRLTTRHSFAMISFIAETFIFLYVGMDALDIDTWKASDKSVGEMIVASGILLILVLVGRAAFVFSLTNIVNFFKNRIATRISLRQQVVIWWAGLIRGAVTIALSYEKFTRSDSTSSKNGSFMITNTIIVVLFSTVVFGSVTKSLIRAILKQQMNIRCSEDTDPAGLEDLHLLFEEHGEDDGHLVNSGLLTRHSSSTIHNLWRKFDDRYMRPVFGGRGYVPRSRF
ncbi:Sodium/hydrogen exchanger 2 [Acorus gramineus]|uniref:Sodium/hydrogen exchanger 2 n=1 Tax=Acorus gramineus TaxID=55184 RepID=A0AAV9BS31_ACOGR|nr:Sodium/hydrogen exchanger 2 [Acorus gramineus]